MEEPNKKKQFFSEEDFAEMERLKELHFKVSHKITPDNRVLINELLKQMAAINANSGNGMTLIEEAEINLKLKEKQRLIKEIDPDFYQLISND